jgi:hypothetical protein
MTPGRTEPAAEDGGDGTLCVLSCAEPRRRVACRDEMDRERPPGTPLCLPKNFVVFDKVVPVSSLAEVEAISLSHCRGK